MTTLEEALTEAAQRGLTHLTLYPTWSNDGKTIYWNARATPSTGHQYVSAAHSDPVEAVRVVLTDLPRAKKRVTATVTAEQLLREFGNSEVISEPEPSLSPEQWK
jgi:hypothetical protein